MRFRGSSFHVWEEDEKSLIIGVLDMRTNEGVGVHKNGKAERVRLPFWYYLTNILT